MDTRLAGAAEAVEKETEINEEKYRLLRSIQRLDDVVRGFGNRLEAVLAPQRPPEDPKVKLENVPNSRLGTELAEMTQQVGYLEGYVADLHDRLRL